MKESPREQFRWAPHTGGLAVVKRKDYETGGEVDALSPYALWKEGQEPNSPHRERPLGPGDLLEQLEADVPQRLFIVKYIGFEPAEWFVPESRPVSPPLDEASIGEREDRKPA